MAVRAANQESAALEPMWQAHRDAIRRLLLSFTRDLDLADDLLQETYLRARAGIACYRGGDAHAWLAAIARNVHRSYRRQRYVSAEVPVGLCDEAEAAPSYDRHDLLMVLQALSTFTPALRTALIMKHYSGFTYAEIAQRQQCPEGTVKRRVSEALGKLRAALQPERRTAMAGSVEAHGIPSVDYVYGVLPAAEAAKVRAHLQGCAHCREQVDGLKQALALLDGLQGELRRLESIEVDRGGGATLSVLSYNHNWQDTVMETLDFGASERPDHVYQDGEELEVASPSDWPVAGHRVRLRRPVPPGGAFWLLVQLPPAGPGAPWLASLGEGRFRFHWRHGCGATLEVDLLRMLRLPGHAGLLTAAPQPDEVRRNGRTTLVWHVVMPAQGFFETTAEYRLEGAG